MTHFSAQNKEFIITEGLLSEPADFLKSLLPYNRGTVCLHGEMGAGKTTFVRRFVSLFDIGDNVNSPSFSLLNIYGNGRIHHFDLYRLKSVQEVEDLGFSEIWESDTISLIEWPERAEYLIPENAVHLEFTHLSPKKRKILFK